MARIVAIGHQDFSQVIQNNYFYIDKTRFIREWWENGDAVTLITQGIINWYYKGQQGVDFFGSE